MHATLCFEKNGCGYCEYQGLDVEKEEDLFAYMQFEFEEFYVVNGETRFNARHFIGIVCKFIKRWLKSL